jgi:hypothetical protein
VATLRLNGVRLAEDTPLPLAVGWNLVSYLPQSTLPVTVALASIAGKYAVVQGFDRGALSFYPDLDPIFNTLLVMQPGLGYWIRATQAVTLTYPSAAGLASASAAGPRLMTIPQPQASPLALLGRQDERAAPIRQVERAAGVTPTSTWVDFYGEARQVDGALMPIGTLITALDPQGIVCGATVVTVAGQYGYLACYGDDPHTAADEGAAPGERIRLMVDGQVLGTGDWTSRGERRRAPLGNVVQEPQRYIYLPLVLQGANLEAPARLLPAEPPTPEPTEPPTPELAESPTPEPAEPSTPEPAEPSTMRTWLPADSGRGAGR